MPTNAYQRATEREVRFRKAADKAATERASELAKMHQSGMSYAAIAVETGLSRSRVQQLIERASREQK
jgi:DNA-directed RNA polymerase specialized sigma24 family protein